MAKSAMPRGLPTNLLHMCPSRDHRYHVNLPNQYQKL